MKRLNFLMACGVAVLPMAAVAQTVLLSEDFESYADQAALEAAWIPSEAGYLTFNNNAGQGAEGSNKYVTMPNDFAPPSTGADPYSYRNFTSHNPTDEDPITLTVYVRSANWGNSRAGISLRTNPASTNIFMLGTNNGVLTDRFAARIVGWGSAPGFIYFESGPSRKADTWFKLSGTIGDATATFKVDDKDMNETASLTSAPTGGLGTVRIGNGTSANAVVDIDNITVTKGLPSSSVSDWDLY